MNFICDKEGGKRAVTAERERRWRRKAFCDLSADGNITLEIGRKKEICIQERKISLMEQGFWDGRKLSPLG